MAHFWRDGDPIEVTLTLDGVPGHLTRHGKTYVVEEVIEAWRMDDGWWGKRVWRDYFWIATDPWCVMVIYQDRVTGLWYLQRLYD